MQERTEVVESSARQITRSAPKFFAGAAAALAAGARWALRCVRPRDGLMRSRARAAWRLLPGYADLRAASAPQILRMLPATLQRSEDDSLHVVHDEASLRRLSLHYKLNPSNMRTLVLGGGNLKPGEKKSHERQWIRFEDIKAIQKVGDGRRRRRGRRRRPPVRQVASTRAQRELMCTRKSEAMRAADASSGDDAATTY